jgi:hypothetical protein
VPQDGPGPMMAEQKLVTLEKLRSSTEQFRFDTPGQIKEIVEQDLPPL